jgi:hypothetical protein
MACEVNKICTAAWPLTALRFSPRFASLEIQKGCIGAICGRTKRPTSASRLPDGGFVFLVAIRKL